MEACATFVLLHAVVGDAVGDGVAFRCDADFADASHCPERLGCEAVRGEGGRLFADEFLGGGSGGVGCVGSRGEESGCCEHGGEV